MSNFTTQIRFICETAYGLTESKGYSNLDEILEAGREYIFDFDYPIFDTEYKSVLETKILKHYYTREISEETVGLWKLRLNARMSEIMPYFNKLYESELLLFNPLYDVDYTRSGDREGNSTDEETRINNDILSDAMTGTVTDNRNSLESDSRQANSTENNNLQSTVNELINENSNANKTLNSTKENIGNQQEYNSGIKKGSGTESRESQGLSMENTTGSRVTENSGTDTDTINRDNLSDHWDYYSDTPQGTIGFIPGSSGTPQADAEIRNQTYLTNVRHITDDTTGSEEVKETEHGHIVNENTNGSKESNIQSSDVNTRNLTENTENTGVVDKTDRETGSNIENSVQNAIKTGENIKNETGAKTGTESISGERTNEDQNVRTYNTLSNKTGNTTASKEGKAKNLEEYTEHVIGKTGGMTYAKMLMEFRETFLNIDALIINELSDLFFGLWE